MEARLLHVYQKYGVWTLLHGIDTAVPVSGNQVPGKPTSILDIDGYYQDVLVALQSAMEHHVRFGW